MRDERRATLSAAASMDWQQVTPNGGPLCFHLLGERFCGRAERWPGHRSQHQFVPLVELLGRVMGASAMAREIVRESESPLPSAEEKAAEVLRAARLKVVEHR